MKKAKCVVIFLITIFFLCDTVIGASSARDIEITEIKILETEREVHITLKNLPRPIGFEVFLNGKEITENCKIRFGTDLLSISSILIAQLPKDYLNTSNTLFIHFYDEIDSKEFTETFVYLSSKQSKINWWLVLGVIVGLISFNLFGGALMSKKGKKTNPISKNPLIKQPTHKEMTIKTIIALIISIGLFIYTSFNPYFYYPQLVDHNWKYAYDFLDYFTMGGFLVAIIGLSHHLFLLALGKHRKKSIDTSSKSIGSINYYFQKIVGGTDTSDSQLNKEKNPSLVVISKTVLILTIVFALRILMLLLVSTLFDYSPQNFRRKVLSKPILTYATRARDKLIIEEYEEREDSEFAVSKAQIISMLENTNPSTKTLNLILEALERCQ